MALNSKLLAGESICNGRAKQLGGARHHMKLVCKSSEARGECAIYDANTDLDTTSGVHFRLDSKNSVKSIALADDATDVDTTSCAHFQMNSDSSVCSVADTQEWMSESDWFAH
jgi:hypothetical protein